MPLITEGQCLVPTCGNIATEKTELNYSMNEINKDQPLFCVCHVKGHTLRVKEYSNAYSLIECETSTCSYEERVEVSLDCKEVGLEDNKTGCKPFHTCGKFK